MTCPTILSYLNFCISAVFDSSYFLLTLDYFHLHFLTYSVGPYCKSVCLEKRNCSRTGPKALACGPKEQKNWTTSISFEPQT